VRTLCRRILLRRCRRCSEDSIGILGEVHRNLPGKEVQRNNALIILRQSDWHLPIKIRALQLRREARMVSTVMGAAMIGTMYFLRSNCAQHGGSASGGGLISASLLSYRALIKIC